MAILPSTAPAYGSRNLLAMPSVNALVDLTDLHRNHVVLPPQRVEAGVSCRRNTIIFRIRNDLEQIGFNPAEVKAIAKSWQVPSIDNNGEPTTRAGIGSDDAQFEQPRRVAGRVGQRVAAPAGEAHQR